MAPVRLSIFMLLLTTVHVLAQSSSSQPFPSTYEVQKIPANPDVAQLGRFGDIPVNKYNGTANVTIPIYEIDHDGLKIPIALKYNTGGIRVEQEASWVGLGWSLSDGMTVTREVNGFEDIYNYDHLIAESVGWIYSRDYLFPDSVDAWAPGLSQSDLVELQTKMRLGNKQVDTEPDFFTVSLPSGSCKFTLPKIQNNDTLLVANISDSKNFKVIYDRVNYKFIITDPAGFVYDFTITEMSTGYGSYENFDTSTKKGILKGIVFPIFHGRHMISSWRISKITSPRGRILTFSYTNGFYFSYPHFVDSHTIVSGNRPSFEPAVVSGSAGTPDMFANLTAFDVKNLSVISGAFGSIEFILSNRSDLVSKKDKLSMSGLSPTSAWNTYLFYGDSLIARKVDQVVVKNKANEVIKTANLTYGYFNSPWVGQEPDYTATDPLECDVSYIRLKLNEVTIGDQRYQFDYYQPNALPRKDSRSVDFWGFYNGVSNVTKAPSFNRFYANHPGATGDLDDEWFEIFRKITAGNRKADINYGKTGILQKITYPTGGSTVFDYENHKVTLSNVNYYPKKYLSNGSGQLRFSSLDSSTNYNYSYQYLKLAKTPSYSLYDLNTCSITSNTVLVNTGFQITETSFCTLQDYNLKINATINCSTGCGQGTPSGRAVWVRNVSTGQEYDIYNHNTENSRTLETTLNLPVGTYELRTAHWTQSSPTVVVTVSAYATTYTSDPIAPLVKEEFEVGGARIKSVTNYDRDGSFVSRSHYLYDQYVTESGQQVSNGKLMDELIFHSKAQNLFDYSAIDFLQNSSGTGAVLSSDSKIRTSASAGGSHIGYGLVREEKLDLAGNTLGQMTTEFSNKPNEHIFKPNEALPKITLGNIEDDDFNTKMEDLNSKGVTYYPVYYGTVYVLGVRPITYDYSNGSVLREKTYNQSGTLIRETINTYSPFSVLTNQNGSIGANAGEYPLIYFLGKFIIHFQPYMKIAGGTHRLNMIQPLISTVTTEYSGGVQTSTTINNYYDNPDHFLLTRSTSSSSDGSFYTTKNYYPKDLSGVPFMSDLVASNQVTIPVIMERYKGTTLNPLTTLLEKVQTFYSNTNSPTGDVLPKEVYTYMLGETTGQQRVLYEKYSTYGTLIQYRKSNENMPVALIWGHDNLLPLAQIVNAQSNQVAFTSFDEPTSNEGGWTRISGTATASASKAGIKSTDTGSTLEKSGLPSGNYVVGFWAKLITGSSGTVTINGTPITITDSSWKYYEVTRNGTSVSVSNSNIYVDELRLYPAGAQMTSFTYKPLMGITSRTGPDGNVTYYVYDAHGRLQFIKDDQGNVLKKVEYQYQTGSN